MSFDHLLGYLNRSPSRFLGWCTPCCKDLLRVCLPIDHAHGLLIQLSVALYHEFLERNKVVNSCDLIYDLPVKGIH